jgi:LysR family transcriptional regulator, carnitine catabolism transcriptional activator
MTSNVRQLEAFVRVYREGSVSNAARSMYLTQSAVSVLIRQVEGRCGIRLFDRTKRTLRPTRAADDIIAAAEKILEDFGDLEARVHTIRNRSRTQIDIAVTPAFGTLIMPAVVAEFRCRHPGVKVVVHDIAPDQVTRRLLDKDVEFAIGAYDAQVGVEIEPILSCRLVVVCRRDSPLARRRRITWADVNRSPVVVIRRGNTIRAWIDESLAGAGEQFLPALEVSQFSSAIAMVQEGIGCTILPSYVDHDYSALGLSVRTVDEPPNTRVLTVMKRAGAILTAPATDALELIRGRLLQRGDPKKPFDSVESSRAGR